MNFVDHRLSQTMQHNRRFAEVKNAALCTDGGFVRLQTNLLHEKPVGCHACQALLRSCNFDASEFAAAIADDAMSKPMLAIEDAPRKADTQDDAADVEEQEDPLDYVRSFAPVIELLDPGTFGKSLPFRCVICKSKSQPDGKVGNLNYLTKTAVTHFLRQHLDSATHQRNLKAYEIAKHGKPVPCEALLVSDPSAGCLYEVQKEFELWVGHANLKVLAKHEYWKDVNKDQWFIRAARCQKECLPSAGCRPMCAQCQELGKAKGVCKVVLRFAQKYFLAVLLSARLFQDSERRQEVEAEIKDSLLYKKDPKRMQQILDLSNNKLQQLVRASWLKGTDVHSTETQGKFMTSVVKPALRFNISTVPNCFSDVLTRFSASIASGLFSDRDVAKLKVAAGVLDGRLDEHPLLHGLSLQCMRLLEKQQRGLETMRGRRSQESCLESSLISDAGLRLAMMSNNKSLARELL